jgi:O-antigen/teichoic acid export membrane protein
LIKNSNLNTLFKMIIDNKVVVKNFSFLSVLQVLQLFIGFLLFPYLISVLGSNNYGIIVFAQAVVGYFLLILNYGFNITATKKIAICKNDSKKIWEIITITYITKLFILLLIVIIFISLILLVPFFSKYKEIYLFTVISLVGWFLYPEWYFQGVEKMENITYIILVSKIISLILILVLVKGPLDFFYVPIINSISMIISGILGVILLIKSVDKFGIFHFSYNNIKVNLIEGFPIFLSNITANTKDYFNTFIIGFLFNYDSVAIYDFANKIIKILIIPSSILYRVFFPKISVTRSFKTIFKLESWSLLSSLFFIIIILIIPEQYYSIFVKSETNQFKKVLFLLSLSLPLLSLIGSRGMLGLVAFNYSKYFTLGIVLSMLFYSLTVLVLYYFNIISLITISITLVLSLLVEFLSHTYFFKKIKIYHA